MAVGVAYKWEWALAAALILAASGARAGEPRLCASDADCADALGPGWTCPVDHCVAPPSRRAGGAAVPSTRPGSSPGQARAGGAGGEGPPVLIGASAATTNAGRYDGIGMHFTFRAAGAGTGSHLWLGLDGAYLRASAMLPPQPDGTTVSESAELLPIVAVASLRFRMGAAVHVDLHSGLGIMHEATSVSGALGSSTPIVFSGSGNPLDVLAGWGVQIGLWSTVELCFSMDVHFVDGGSLAVLSAGVAL